MTDEVTDCGISVMEVAAFIILKTLGVTVETLRLKTAPAANLGKFLSLLL